MPYPPQKTYQQTTPETALDPQRNAISGGTGNAHTIPGTTPGQQGTAMKPFSGTTTNYDIATNLDDGRELIGTSWSGTVTPIINDATANAAGDTGGFDATDSIYSLSFPGVSGTACTSATLTFTGSAVNVAGTFRMAGQKLASPSYAQFDNASNKPSAATLTTARSADKTMVAAQHTIDVTAIVQEIMASGGWTSGSRINLIGYASSIAASMNISNYTVVAPRLTVVTP